MSVSIPLPPRELLLADPIRGSGCTVVASPPPTRRFAPQSGVIHVEPLVALVVLTITLAAKRQHKDTQRQNKCKESSVLWVEPQLHAEHLRRLLSRYCHFHIKKRKEVWEEYGQSFGDFKYLCGVDVTLKKHLSFKR